MNEIEFIVQGSSPDPYKVTFVHDGNEINAFCTCPAGVNGQYCKHRFEILDGIDKRVISENKEEVKLVTVWLQGTSLEKALVDLENAERDHIETKKRLQLSKKNVAKAMRS